MGSKLPTSTGEFVALQPSTRHAKALPAGQGTRRQFSKPSAINSCKLKLNMVHLEISPWKKEIPNLETIIFRFHVKLWGGIMIS